MNASLQAEMTLRARWVQPCPFFLCYTFCWHGGLILSLHYLLCRNDQSAQPWTLKEFWSLRPNLLQASVSLLCDS